MAAEDPNHPNPYLFTGRRFDIETGLYYYRARYYNPYIGRFLQTDPLGDGYQYCGNNPLNYVDPTGLWVSFRFLDYWADKEAVEGKLTFAYFVDGDLKKKWPFDSIDQWCKWAAANPYFEVPIWYWWQRLPPVNERIGWKLSRNIDPGEGHDADWLFWRLQALMYLGLSAGTIGTIEASGQIVTINTKGERPNWYEADENTLYWDPAQDWVYKGGDARRWWRIDPLIGLVHELTHAADDVYGGMSPRDEAERTAMVNENLARWQFFRCVPGYQGKKMLWPRTGYGSHHADMFWLSYFYRRAWFTDRFPYYP